MSYSWIIYNKEDEQSEINKINSIVPSQINQTMDFCFFSVTDKILYYKASLVLPFLQFNKKVSDYGHIVYTYLNINPRDFTTKPF
jgi:hypothetical protein